jgi:hypothetical protein
VDDYGLGAVEAYGADSSKSGIWPGLYGGIQRGVISEDNTVVSVP